MIRVTVVCFGALREYLPAEARDNRVALDVRSPATLGEVVDALGAPRSLVHAALVDGARRELDQVLSEGAEVTLMPPFTGGSSDRSDHGDCGENLRTPPDD